MSRMLFNGGTTMLGLRKDCSLLVKNNNTYLTIKGYHVPISWHMAFMLSLMDGTREKEEVMDTIIELGLASEIKREEIIKEFIMGYSVYLENYPDDFIRSDIPNPECFLKPSQQEISAFDYPLPRAMLFHVTSSCDKACKYCYLDAKHIPLESDILSKSEIFKIIDQLREIGVPKIIYTGGEPFIRSDLMDILQYASEYGIANSITTKHYFTKNETEQLGKMRTVKIALSYDCHIDSIAEFLSGNVGHAKKMDKSIELLVSNGVKLSIEPVVTGINADVMGEFLRHLHNLGVNDVEFHRYVHAGGRHDDCLETTQEQWENVLKLLENDVIKNTHLYNEIIEKVDVEDAALNAGCVNGLASFSVMPNGKVVFCDHMPNVLDYSYGDLKNQSIEEIWNSEARYKMVYPAKAHFINTPCENCNDFNICLKKTACRKQSVLQHGNDLTPSSLTYNLCAYYRNEMIKSQI